MLATMIQLLHLPEWKFCWWWRWKKKKKTNLIHEFKKKKVQNPPNLTLSIAPAAYITISFRLQIAW